MEQTDFIDIIGKEYGRGDLIFRQGESGDDMYIIQSGAVEIKVTGEDGAESVLAILEQGDIFGEMAIFGQERRLATATAVRPTRLLPVSQASLMGRIREDPEIIFTLMRTLCRRIDRAIREFQALRLGDEQVRSSLLRSMPGAKEPTAPDRPAEGRPGAGPGTGPETDSPGPGDGGQVPPWLEENRDQWITVQPGRRLFSQGDEARDMYIIIQGSVEISIDDRGERYVIARLGPRDYFGELGLLSDQPRVATAEALTRAVLLPLSRETLMAELRRSPRVAVDLLRMLINRLRRIDRAMTDPETLAPEERHTLPTFIKKAERLGVGIHSLSTCSGCTTILVDDEQVFSLILETAEIRYCPLLMDTGEITETDIAVVDGMVRTNEDIEVLREIRKKTRYLIAWGTCAAFGGIPSMANAFELEDLVSETFGRTQDVYTYYLSGDRGRSGAAAFGDHEGLGLLRRAWKLDDTVRVDYYLPGCPPNGDLLTDLILELSGREPSGRSRAVVCADCARKPGKAVREALRPYPGDDPAVGQGGPLPCFTTRGVLCMGFLSRGGCGASCTQGGLPCWGCRGPSNTALKKIGNGGSLERVLVHTLARRNRLAAEHVGPVVDLVRDQANNILAFFQSLNIDPARIR